MRRYALFLNLVFLFIVVSCGRMDTEQTRVVPIASEASTNSMVTSAEIETTRPANIAAPEGSLQVPPVSYPTPASTPVFAGTLIPPGKDFVLENIPQLAQVARWGNGIILGAAFLPDGSGFVVGSAYGFGLYSLDNLSGPPTWIPFEQPFFYHSLYFSEDSGYLLLEGFSDNQIRSFPEGQLVRDLTGISWVRTTDFKDGWGEIKFTSPNGELELKSHITFLEEFWEIEFSVREVFKTSTGELLYELRDETIQVEFEDRTEPESCDGNSFSPCGNAFTPIGAHPLRGGFSPTNKSLAILYSPPDLYNSSYFQIMRVYQASDGNLLSEIGSFDQPVATFAYSPDGKTVLVGYVDGALELRDERGQSVLFSSWDFNGPQLGLDYSVDGQYLIVQRPSVIEVRSVVDGQLLSRVPGSAFALSPAANRLAVGGADGSVELFDLDDGRMLFNIQAHDDAVLALTFSLDGKYLTSSSYDCTVRNWQADSGGFVNSFSENWTSPDEYTGPSRIFIYFLRYIPGSDHLVGFGSWGRVVNWDTLTGRTQYLIEPESLDQYQGMITLKPHFPEFFVVDEDANTFHINSAVYEIETGKFIDEYQPPDGLPNGCAAVGPASSDGKVLFTAGIDFLNGQICQLDPNDYHLLNTLPVVSWELDNYGHGIEWLYLSPNGNQMILSMAGGVLLVYQVIQ